jgi:hypothetical protein
MVSWSCIYVVLVNGLKAGGDKVASCLAGSGKELYGESEKGTIIYLSMANEAVCPMINEVCTSRKVKKEGI